MKTGWVTKRLGEVCEELRERIPSTSVLPRQYVGTENMLKECAGIVDSESVPKDVGLVRYQKGDILLSNIRPYLKKSWLSDRDGGCSSDVIVFRPSQYVVAEYLWRVLSQDRFFDYSMLKVGGAKMPRGDRNWIKAFEFSYPESLAEQKRIVAKIDAAFEKIDKLKANAERNLANAKELFQSTLNEAMRPKPGWVEKRLGEIGSVQTGSTPSTRDKANFGCFIPFVKPGDITTFDPIAYRSEGLSEKGLVQTRFIPKGSVLMVCIGASIGKVAWANRDCATNQQINALSPSNGYDGEFVALALATTEFQNSLKDCAGQATLPIVSKSKWESLRIYVPSLNEQRSIVSGLTLILSWLKRLQQNYTRLMADCAEMRQAVLKEAFEGRL